MTGILAGLLAALQSWRCSRFHQGVLTWETIGGVPVLYVQCTEENCRRASVGIGLGQPPSFVPATTLPYWWVTRPTRSYIGCEGLPFWYGAKVEVRRQTDFRLLRWLTVGGVVGEGRSK